MNIIETQNLTKTYGDFTAVSHLNLHIRKGSVYGFLGPNGAGKSTTMKMFLGLTQPTEGSFHIDGKTYPSDRVPILKEVGSFIEAPAFYGNLSGEENLEIMVAYGRAAEGVYETQIAWLPWLPVAVGITILALVVSCMRYGASERR